MKFWFFLIFIFLIFIILTTKYTICIISMPLLEHIISIQCLLSFVSLGMGIQYSSQLFAPSSRSLRCCSYRFCSGQGLFAICRPTCRWQGPGSFSKRQRACRPLVTKLLRYEARRTCTCWISIHALTQLTNQKQCRAARPCHLHGLAGEKCIGNMPRMHARGSALVWAGFAGCLKSNGFTVCTIVLSFYYHIAFFGVPQFQSHPNIVYTIFH